MDKKSFVIYKNWAEIIKRLPKEDAGELIQAVCNYKTESDYQISNPYIAAIFEGQIKPQLEVDSDKYQRKCERIAEVNRRRKEERRHDTDNSSSRNRNDIVGDTDTDTDTVTDTDTDNNLKRERGKKFAPPSLEEVRAYCQERNNNVDPEGFINFYQSKGWMVGKNKMKDWKACVITWEKRDKKSQVAVKNEKIHNFMERDYSPEFYDNLIKMKAGGRS